MRSYRSSSRRPVRAGRRMRRMSERFDLVDVQFALQSLEDASMFVASEDAGVNEAEDEKTGLQFTDSMDENRVVLFPTHEEAKSFVEDNDATDVVKIVTVQVVPDEEVTPEEAEAVQECLRRHRMSESRRAPRSLREGREVRRTGRFTARRGFRR